MDAAVPLAMRAARGLGVLESLSFRRVRPCSWQAPAEDCYKLFGISPTATAAEIKAAYFQRAKLVHPDRDSTKSGSNAMVQLNLCFEALSRRRAEYDAAKGTHAQRPKYQQPWWSQSTGDDAFNDFAQEWEESVRQRRGRPDERMDWQAQTKRQSQPRSWRQWAADWRANVDESEHDESSDEEWSRGPGWKGARSTRGQKRRTPKRQHRHEDFDGWEEDEMPPRSRGKQKQQVQFVPDELLLAVPGSWEAAGSYGRLEQKFNGRPAFCRAGSKHFFLFWSREFGDWKVAHHLVDDGTCIAFSEDQSGRQLPWAARSPKWRIWHPAKRSFVQRKLRVEICVAESEDDEDESVPWSRPPWEQWSTGDLTRWCERLGIDLHGCFDRESVLEVVREFSKMSKDDQEGAGSQEHRAAHSDGGPDSTGGRHKNGSEEVQLASRVKTDGSYTRRPSLDPTVTHFGNRVEPFLGEETELLPWMQARGDKSRIYGVYVEASFRYCLVWKKRKYWGRANYW